MYQDYRVGEYKATKGLRFLNYIIDLISIYVLLVGIYILVVLVEYFIKGHSEVEIYLEQMSNLEDRIYTSLFYLLFIFMIEFLTKGRSLGKLITGTKVVMIDGSAPAFKDYFIRSLCRIIPFDQISFFGNNGFHDKFSKTTVVHKKNFEASITLEDSIVSIGNTVI